MTTAFPTQFLYPYAAATPRLVQSAGASTSVSGPASFTQTVTATTAANLLVWAVAVNASAGAALGATPTGWTLQTTQAVATLALGIYTYPNNPGGITSVALSSPTATTGGIVGWFYEISGVLTGSFELARSATGSSTTPSSGANYTPLLTNEMVISAVGWVAAGALTAVTVPAAGWTSNAVQTSTNGTTNASLVTQTLANSPWVIVPVNTADTLSVSAVWNAALLVIPTQLSMKGLLAPPSGTAGFLTGQYGSYAVGG